MLELLVAALVLLCVPYVLGPVAVLRQYRFPDRYRFQRIDGEVFVAEQTPTFKMLHESVMRLGFSHVGSSKLTISGVVTHFSIYLSEQGSEFCTISTIESKLGATTQVEFTRTYEDSSVVNVSNGSTINVYPANWRRESYRFPEMNDVERLFDAAMRLFSLCDRGRKPMAVPKDAAFTLVETYLNQELDALIEKGWVSDTENGGVRELTIKGAILMTWKVCWPVKSLIAWFDTRAAKKALNRA